MPLRLSDRTSNSKALSTICRLLFRRVSFLAFRTRSSSMSMLVLMRRLYTILKHFCASRCDSVSKLAPRVEAAAMLDRRARAASRPIRMLVRFSQAVFNRGQVQPRAPFSKETASPFRRKLSSCSAMAGRLKTSQCSPELLDKSRPAKSSSCQRVWVRTIAPPGASRV